MAERLRFSGRRGRYSRWFVYRLFKGKQLLYVGCTGKHIAELNGKLAWRKARIAEEIKARGDLREEATSMNSTMTPQQKTTKSPGMIRRLHSQEVEHRAHTRQVNR